MSLLFSILFILILNFGLNIFTNDKFKKFIKSRVNSEKTVELPSTHFTGNLDDKKWAKKLLNGGYIVYIRHAKRRTGFPSASILDLLEAEIHENGINGTRYAENDYFGKGICLTDDGKIQAKAIGELLKEISFPVGEILTSPSDKMDKNLLHTGFYYETKKKRFNDLRDFFSSIDVDKNKNTIITAHGNVIMQGLFENPKQRNLHIEQAGMIILSKNNDSLKIDYTFQKFDLFFRALFER